MTDLSDRVEQLEQKIEEQETQLERQREIIERQSTLIETHIEDGDRRGSETDESDTGTSGPSLTRRGALKAGGLAGVGLLSAESVTANQHGSRGNGSQPDRGNGRSSGIRWNRDRDAQGNDLLELGGLSTEAHGRVEEFDGVGLELDSARLGIANGGVDTAQLASGAVELAQLGVDLDGTGLEIDGETLGIEDDGVDTAQLAPEAVTSEQLSGGAVTSSALAAGAVVTETVADDAITAAKIDDGAVAIDVNGTPVSSLEFDDPLTVTIDDDTATVGIELESSFNVRIGEVTFGERGSVTVLDTLEAIIENNGTVVDSQAIVLSARTDTEGQLFEVTQTVELAPEESTTIVFDSEEIRYGVSLLEVKLSSEDDTETRALTP